MDNQEADVTQQRFLISQTCFSLTSYQITWDGQRILVRCSLIYQLRAKCQVSSAIRLHLLIMEMSHA